MKTRKQTQHILKPDQENRHVFSKNKTKIIDIAFPEKRQRQFTWHIGNKTKTIDMTYQKKDNRHVMLETT